MLMLFFFVWIDGGNLRTTIIQSQPQQQTSFVNFETKQESTLHNHHLFFSFSFLFKYTNDIYIYIYTHATMEESKTKNENKKVA